MSKWSSLIVEGQLCKMEHVETFEKAIEDVDGGSSTSESEYQHALEVCCFLSLPAQSKSTD